MRGPEIRSPASEHPTAVKSKTPLIEQGRGSRQEETITLPDRQTITVRGQKQKGALRLLITAFNQGKPYVTNEELLGFDITKGISLSLKRRQTLHNAVARLKKKTLTETGWDIQSITITGKGVETRPQGYTLKKDQAQKAVAPASYLQSIFDNENDLKELVINGPGKTSILEKAKQQINSLDPQEKIIFLEKTFAILSDPNPEHQDQRDAALELLNIMDLKSIDPKELTKTYIKAVSNLLEELNQDSDPYGEIHALLEAGKTIAPFIENSRGITQAWSYLAKAFAGDYRQKILDDIKEIRQLIPKTFSEFDAKVATHIQKGLRNQQIAGELEVEIPDILRSISRLKNRGMRLGSFNRGKGTMQTKQQKLLFEGVKERRTKGMGNLEIASALGTPQKKINRIAGELIRKGEIPPIYNLKKRR